MTAIVLLIDVLRILNNAYLQKKAAKTLQPSVFIDKENATTRYNRKWFDIENQINTFVNIVSLNDKNDGSTFLVYQKELFYLVFFIIIPLCI